MFANKIAFLFVYFNQLLIKLFTQFGRISFRKFLFADFRFETKIFDHFQRELFVIFIPFKLSHNKRTTIEECIVQIKRQTLTKQGIPTTGINNFTLRIHHIIIFQQSFTDTEIIFFYFFLGTFDRFSNHAMLNHIAFFMSQFIHPSTQTITTKQTHQIIFQ